MSATEELLHLGTSRIDAGQYGEDWLLALQYLLVQHVVGFVELHQSRCTEDDHDGIDVLELLLAVVDGDAQVFGCSRCQDVDGVGHRRAGEQLCLQLFALRTAEGGHLHATLGEGIGEHDARTAGMGDDGAVATREAGKREDTSHGGQFLTREAAHNAGFAEQSLDGRVTGGNGTRMTAGGTTASRRRTSLDSSDTAALLDERRSMVEQFIGVSDILDIEQFHQ